jgi:diacylglycerol kinase family enzyme
VRVSADREFALEMDGEVVAATEAVFRLIPARVRCCR